MIFLKAIVDMIDSMANWSMLDLHTSDLGSSVMFDTDAHQRLFHILLVDFLSTTDPKAARSRTSFLGALKRIIAHPHFDVKHSIRALADATHACDAWFQHEAEIEVWLPSLDAHALLKLSRVTYLRMSGNIAKHDPLRLGVVAEQLRSALVADGIGADLDDALVALDGFYERFHEDILNYHASTIVELLNSIRWGIYEYLQPELRRSYRSIVSDVPRWEFTYPADVRGKFARIRYWSLMDAMQRQPILPQFRTIEVLRRNKAETRRAYEP